VQLVVRRFHHHTVADLRNLNILSRALKRNREEQKKGKRGKSTG
jgi:hypothetical protein